MSDDLLDELDDSEVPDPPTTIEEELADVELAEPDGDILDELDEIETPDPGGDFEEYSGMFTPGIGDVYAAGGTFLVESVVGTQSSGGGMNIIKTDRGDFAYPRSLRVGVRYRADDSGEGITLEEVTGDE